MKLTQISLLVVMLVIMHELSHEINKFESSQLFCCHYTLQS